MRRNWVSAIGADAAAVGQSAFLHSGFSDPTMVMHWEAIAGPDVAVLTRPLRLTQGPHEGVLTLLCEPGAAIFLQHESPALCDRINTFLGRAVVSRFKFVQRSLPKRPPPAQRRHAPGPMRTGDPAATFEGPDSLREALLRLARARHQGS